MISSEHEADDRLAFCRQILRDLASVSEMKLGRIISSLISVLLWTQCSMCSMIGERREVRQLTQTAAEDEHKRPGNIPHMWSERQHNERVHPDKHHHQHDKGDDTKETHRSGHSGHIDNKNNPAAHMHNPQADSHKYIPKRTPNPHLQSVGSHIGTAQVLGKNMKKDMEDRMPQLHRTNMNNVLKSPVVDPDIAGAVESLNLLSVMKLANMGHRKEDLTQPANVSGHNQVSSRNLKRLQTDRDGRSRYAIVTTRVRTRAKRSDEALADDYTWAVIVGGSGLAILFIVMCACVCARCNTVRKNPDSGPTVLHEPTPAVFFVGRNNNTNTEPGYENMGFALGDIHGPGPTGTGSAGFTYTALEEDEDCASARGSAVLEKS